MTTQRTLLLLLAMLLTLGVAACDSSKDDSGDESKKAPEPDYMKIASEAPRLAQTVPIGSDDLVVSIELPENYNLWKRRGDNQRWSYVNKEFVNEGDPVFSELAVPFIELGTVYDDTPEEAAADEAEDVEGEVLRNEAAGDAWILAYVETDDDDEELTMLVYKKIGETVVSCQGEQDLDKTAKDDAMALIESICTSVKGGDA